MRKEYVTYNSDLPIQITYATIKEYPLHWHNAIEIVYVLKGKINIFNIFIVLFKKALVYMK